MQAHSWGQLQCALSGSQHTRQGQGFVLLQPCTVALPMQHWLIALSLSVSPLVLLSQTCHLVPPGVDTPVGHFLSPLSSELILASPSLIFLHCLSPTFSTSAEPSGSHILLQRLHVTRDCPSHGCHACRWPPRPSPPALPCAHSLARPALLAPSQAPAQWRGALSVLGVPAVPHASAVTSNLWLPGEQNAFSADLRG